MSDKKASAESEWWSLCKWRWSFPAYFNIPTHFDGLSICYYQLSGLIKPNQVFTSEVMRLIRPLYHQNLLRKVRDLRGRRCRHRPHRFPPSDQLPTLFFLLLSLVLSLDSLDGLSSSNSVFLDFRELKWPSRHSLNHALRSLATPPGMKQSCQLCGNVRFIFVRSCTSLSDITYRAGD